MREGGRVSKRWGWCNSCSAVVSSKRHTLQGANGCGALGIDKKRSLPHATVNRSVAKDRQQGIRGGRER